MSEDAGQVPPPKVRRGLPRVAGADSPVAAVSSPVVAEEAVAASPSAAPTAAFVPTATPADVPAANTGQPRRRGLPRTADAVAAPTENVLAPAVISATPAAATGGTRRSGLARTPQAPTAVREGSAGAQVPSETAPAPIATAHPTTRRSLTQTTAQPKPAAATDTKFDIRAFIKSPRGLIVAAVGLLVVLSVVVLAARWLVMLEFMKEFLITYPGESHLPANAPVGLPAWLGWQHFLNAFFLVLIIRTGWQVRTQTRPPASWTRNNSGFIKTKNPPKKISLTLWAHLSLDALWAINGIIFIVVLFATGQWMRVVPTSWDVFPNALSAALQYLSLNWPTDENGWLNYNSLQVLAYFLTIFVAAPLAGITGFRMSGAWPLKATRLNKVYPIEVARAIHFPVMLYFVLFIIAHISLVMATGALRNLNHMFAAQDTGSWAGFWIFFASLLVMAGAVFASRPLVWAPIAQLFGKVGR